MEITWNGDWFFSKKSHANINRKLVIALHKLGHKLQVTGIIDDSSFDANNTEHTLIKQLEKNKFVSDYNIYKFSAVSGMKPAKFNCVLHSDGSYCSNTFNNKLLEDSPSTHLWLPTPDCAKEVDKFTPKPAVGLGVDSGIDPSIFNTKVEEYDYGFPSNIFKFMLACDGVNTTPSRPLGGFRGSDIAIKAFAEKFNNNIDCVLIVKAAKPKGALDTLINELQQTNNIKIIKDYGLDPQKVIAQKWKAADCMLSPIRDCRWEACVLEALACGTPAIATKCGGPLLYGKHGVYFVSGNKIPGDLHKSRGKEAVGEDYWTEPSVDDFGNKMLEVFDNPRTARELGSKGSDYVINNWKWEDIANRITQFFV